MTIPIKKTLIPADYRHSTGLEKKMDGFNE